MAGMLDDLVEQRHGAGFDPGFSDDEQAAPAWAQRFAARWSERRGHMQQHLGGDDGTTGEAYAGQQGMLLEALHELLQQTRHVREDATSAAQVAVGQQRPLSQREMMSVLSLLQATPSATLRAAIGEDGESLAQRLKSEVLSSATQLGVDPGQTRLDPQDEDAIDLVGMLFDVMLDERELEGRSRKLIGRLVVPFVKVAMLDRRMFVQKTHPARKLLNSLAEACEGNTGESQAERMLMAKVEEIIERLVAEFNENLAIFLTLEEEFREFLVQHRRRVEIAERRAAETQRGQEKLEMARARAGAELDRRIGDASLPCGHCRIPAPAVAASPDPGAAARGRRRRLGGRGIEPGRRLAGGSGRGAPPDRRQAVAAGLAAGVGQGVCQRRCARRCGHRGD